MVDIHIPSQGPQHPSHRIDIPVDTRGTNLPVIYNCHCTQEKRDTIGLRLRTGFFCQPSDMRESWNVAQTAQARSELGITRKWNDDSSDFEYELNAMQQICCPCVGDNANANLSGPQRELILWHWKLGCSMKRVQQNDG